MAPAGHSERKPEEEETFAQGHLLGQDHWAWMNDRRCKGEHGDVPKRGPSDHDAPYRLPPTIANDFERSCETIDDVRRSDQILPVLYIQSETGAERVATGDADHEGARQHGGLHSATRQASRGRAALGWLLLRVKMERSTRWAPPRTCSAGAGRGVALSRAQATRSPHRPSDSVRRADWWRRPVWNHGFPLGKQLSAVARLSAILFNPMWAKPSWPPPGLVARRPPAP